MNTIEREGTFDSGHRVLNEKFKCFNLHGHTYRYRLVYEYLEQKAIGYEIDFKEIKRVVMQFIDDYLDHGFIANPLDTEYLQLVKKLGHKHWVMSLNGNDYCNPTAENISKELFMIGSILLNSDTLILRRIDLWETPSCMVTCTQIVAEERYLWLSKRKNLMNQYKQNKGIVNYDDRI